jgi:hypothetical protein
MKLGATNVRNRRFHANDPIRTGATQRREHV